MIRYQSLKNWLLKAVSLSKTRQGLVLVQRVANGKTGTYLVHKWIRPDKVGANDRVLAGHHNLQQGHPQRPAQVRSLSSPAPIPQSVKDATNRLFQQCNQNPQLFFKVLQLNLGLSWKTANSQGLNLMRAKMALNNAQANGLDLSTIPVSILGLNNPVAPQQAAPVQPPAPQPSPTPPPASPAQPSPATQSPTSTTLPPKAKKASQSSKDAAKAFANSFPSRQDFYDALTKMGITWANNAHAGINIMRAQEALSLHIESGFDVNAAWSAVQNGTPQQQPQPAPVQPQPAPPPQLVAPPVDKSLLEVPANATPAQIELIKHINNMTDYKTIRKCSVMGMVPEDDVASDYITGTLLNSLKNWVTGSNHQKKCPAAVAKKFIKDMSEIGEDVKAVAAKVWNNNSERLVDSLSVTGCKKDVISGGLNLMFESTNMAMMVSPVDFINPTNSYKQDASGAIVPFTVAGLMGDLNDAYMDYTTDQPFPDNKGKTNLGYTGYTFDEYSKRYDSDKEGFVRFLQKVKQDNPKDAEVAAEVDSMIADYNEAMKAVGYNPNFLTQILLKKSWGKPKRFTSWDFGSISSSSVYYDPETLKTTLAGAEAQSDAIISVLKSKGYSSEDIIASVNNWYYNDDLSRFRVKNAKTGDVDTVNIYSAMSPSDQSKYGSDTSQAILGYAVMKLQAQAGLSDDDAIAKGWYRRVDKPQEIRQWMENAQHYASFSQVDYDKVHKLANRIFGTDINTPSRAKSVILSNVIMANSFNSAAEKIALDAADNALSAANKNGTDYTGNFDFYTHHGLTHRSDRTKNMHNVTGSPTYTVQELSYKIKSQLNSVPTYSADYLHNLTQHYSDKAKSQGLSGSTADIVSVAKEDKLENLDLSGNLDSLLDSPMKDVVYKTASSILLHVPKMAQDLKFQEKIGKKLNYVPYDFTTAAQPRRNPPPKTKPQNLNAITNVQLKAAREKLFKAASLSLATESDQVSEQMRKDINQNRFDYKAGEKTPDGKTFNGPFHRTSSQDNRCVLYNSRFFAIHNSIQEERFKKKQEELKAAHPNNPDMWTSMDLFHGTARGCAGGILGRDAGWWMGKSTDYTAAGKMLGPGAYFGYKLGKSTVYAGDVPYSNVHYHGGDNPPPGDADGVVIMAHVMRGDNYVKYMTTNESYSSVSTDSQRDWEMAVRDNALIFPHHFVDVSCRAYKKNVKTDANGNYLDDKGNITHDKYGKSVNMK